MKIKLKSSAKRVLANVFSAKVDDGNALIPENIRKDVKIFDVVGTYGTAPVTPEDLVPFRVGQTIKGVTIDPTAKSNDEIVEWLNTFSFDGNNPIILVREEESGASSNIVMVGENDGIKTLQIFEFLFFFPEDVPGMASKGWNLANRDDGSFSVTPITEKRTFNEGTHKISIIADKFAFLNGTVLGAVEGLAPFRVGQTVSGIKVDTNAKTNEELAAFAAQFDSGEGFEKGLVGNIIGVQGSADFGYIIQALGDTDDILWASKAIEDLDGLNFPSAGWYLINSSTSSIEKVSGIVELQLGETITVNNIDTSFSELNGTVFGAIEGEIPQETLIPFRVGQIVKGINFNSSLKPVNGERSTEMDNFLASLTYNDSDLYIFAEGITQDQNTEMTMVAARDNNGLYAFGGIIADDSFVPIYSTKVDDRIGAQEGWQNITDGIVILNDLTINRIPDNSNNWNGTLIGAVEGEAPQETLTPFRAGQHINGVTIDPTAKTDEEIVNWLNNLTNEQRLVECSDGANGIAVSEVNGVKAISMFLNPISIVFSVDAVSGDVSIPKGWSYMSQASGGAGITPITERTTLDFNTLEVTQVHSEFDFLNGVAVGVLETEAPQWTLTPFRVGQNITTIKVDTNVRTNEELSTFVSKVLEWYGDSRVLVSDNATNSLIDIQGNADSGYIITAASDTNNNILWVSKGLDLDGKFTFPSAGWYLVNKNDSTFSETSGIVELPFTGLVNVGDSIDATFNSELNGVVFGVVEAPEDNPTETPTQLTQIAVSDTIQGLRFDINQTPDLGKYNLGETGAYSLITSNNSEGTLQESVFKVANLSTLSLGDGLGIVVDGTKVVYSESTGWNSSVLDSNNGINLETPATVTEINSGEFWNGIWAGQL